MINAHELQEIFDFEIRLAVILLKDDPWMIPFKGMKLCKAKKSYPASNGYIHLSTVEWENSNDKAALRTCIRALLADLASGRFNRNLYKNQVLALKLNAIQEITANDICDCKYCGQTTPLTTSKLCVPCKRVDDAVRSDPELAGHILKSLQPLEFTEEEKHEYQV